MRPAGKIAALLILVLSLVSGAAGAGAKTPAVTARSAMLMDAATGQVLFEKKAFTRREPASLTKIMTAILALEYGRLDETVTISKRCASISVGQELRLREGDRISLENLVKAALIYSANDSTVAIAQHVAGTEERFIELMNAKALVVGALDTRFANTNGYHHPSHFSTAFDLARIARYALMNSQFAEIVGTSRDTIRWADGKSEREVGNTNQLVREKSYPGIIGVKTGSTIRAGDCLVAAASRHGRTLISVVLHSDNRYRDTVKLLDYGFDQIVALNLCSRSDLMGSVPVTGGAADQVGAAAGENVEVLVDADDRDQITRKITLAGTLEAPVRAGQPVGSAVFYLRGAELARVDLVAAGEVRPRGLLHRLKKAAGYPLTARPVHHISRLFSIPHPKTAAAL